MSESVLKALLRLFALIGDIHDDTRITGREKIIVRKFLSRHLSNDQVQTYMKMFNEYLSVYNSENIEKGSLRDRKRISLNSMRILSICEQINSELAQDQKVYVIVKLIDYISHGKIVTETELDFMETVSGSFNIPSVEFSGMKAFIMGSDEAIKENADLLVVNNGHGDIKKFRHVLINENLAGTIMFLKIRSTNTWLLRYIGNEDLYLNGQNIQVGETYIFDKGSSIRGSGIKPIYYPEVAGYFSVTSSGTSVVLSARDVNFRFRKSDNGVHELNFSAKTGELVGILGGSGVGKSTTLSILSGTLKPQHGRVLINGYDLYNNEDRTGLQGVIGFVPQDDLLIEELTVYQNLYYNARMCLSNLPEEQLANAVERIIAELDLTEAKNLKVGNPLDKVISGGQRKRINIALELMREPTILFVDEPTSGLSSVDSEMVMNLLKELTFKGKLVIVNIHQPSSDIYKMFDRIMIIDRGGYQVFHGNPSEAIVYFRVQANHANPDEDQCTRCGNVDAEQLLQIIESKVLNEHGKPTHVRKVTPSEWSERFKAFFSKDSGDDALKRPLPSNRFRIPGKLEQTIIFCTREFLARMADKQYVLINLLGPPLLALVLSIFTRTPAGTNYTFSQNENIPAYLFMCVITSMFFGLMVSSEEIIRDRRILKRESFLNLSWFSYINSKVVIMFILSAVQTISFVVAGNIILEIRGMTINHWLVLFTTACFSTLLGLNLSSAFKSVITVYILIPFIIIPQLLFSGVLVKFDKMNAGISEYVPAIGEAMMARWSFEAIAVKQFKDNRYSRIFFGHESELSRHFRADLIEETLNTNLYKVEKYISDSVYEDIVQSKIHKLVTYTGKLGSTYGVTLDESLVDSLKMKKISPALFTSFRNYLDALRDSIIKSRQMAQNSLDDFKSEVSDSIGEADLLKLEDLYVNRMLKRELLNWNEKVQVLETKDKIIPRFEPGYMKASSPYGRAHFYAPSKTLGKFETGTYQFNLIFIWINTIILYMFLYFRIFEKAVRWLSGLRFGQD